MILTTIKVGDHQYQIERMNALDQYNVVRKMSTVLMLLSSVIKQDGGAPKTEFAKLMVAGSANLSNEDSDYVNRLCLSRVKRSAGQDLGWSAIIEPRSGQLMFEDIGAKEMAALVWGVMEAHQFIDFFSAPSSTSGQT